MDEGCVRHVKQGSQIEHGPGAEIQFQKERYDTIN